MNVLWWAVSLGLCFAMLQDWSARAADLPRADEATDYLAPAFIADAHPRWTTTHRNEAALIGDVFAWPTVTLGTVFDSNPFHRHAGARTAAGLAIEPRALLERDAGLQHTLAYGAGDVRLFPNARADVIDGRAGVLHDWLVLPDLTVRAQGEIARRTDPFENVQLVAATPRDGLLQQTSVLGAASVQKTFERIFVTVSGTALRSAISASAAVDPPQGRFTSDETVLTLKGRVGAWLAPVAYTFVESGANWRRLDGLDRGSDGTRTVAGFGVARIGLLGGEVYAGRQDQAYPVPHRALSMAIVGGRVSWSPTPAWTVTAALDRDLGEVAVATVADGLGTPTRTSTALVDVAYSLTPLWTARFGVGAVWIDYVGTPRRDTLTLADLRLDYAVARSFDLTGAIRVSDLHSSVAAAAYGRTDATLGATYHY